MPSNCGLPAVRGGPDTASGPSTAGERKWGGGRGGGGGNGPLAPHRLGVKPVGRGKAENGQGGRPRTAAGLLGTRHEPLLVPVPPRLQVQAVEVLDGNRSKRPSRG